MNGRERVRIAMELGAPDRVPFQCQLAIGHYFVHSGVDPFDLWFRSDAFAEALVRMQRRYGFDGILVNLPGRDPDFERHVERVERDDERGALRVRWKDGRCTVLPRDDNPYVLQQDGRRRFPSLDAIVPDRLFYVDPWDLGGVDHPFRWDLDPEPRPFDDFFPPHHDAPLRAVRARVGDAVSVHAEVFSPFSQLLELVGPQSGLMALLDDPRKVHACLDRLTDGAIALGRRHVASGADAVLISSAYAGARMISRRMYAEFVLPYERRLVTALRGTVPVYTHTCGAIGDRLDLMLESGTQGIDTLDPPPLGTVALADAVATLRGRAFIKGNLDPVHTLLRGSPADVERAVLERIAIAGPGGGYILSSACSVAPGVRPQVIERIGELTRSHGVYPLQ